MIKMIILDKRIVQDSLVAGLAFHPIEIFISGGFLHALFLFYIIASFRLLRLYRQQLKNFFSTTKNLEFSWLSIFIISFSLMWTIGFVNSYLSAKTGAPVPVLSFINLALIFFIANMAVYKGLKQPEIFSGIEERSKYERSTLTRSDTDRHLIKLKSLMDEEKPYLDPFLNINQLARRLNIQPRHLSQILNESLHQNFYDFVNSYRIEDAKKMLLESSNKKTTVLEVLLDAGFNSKSAFNRAFKKCAGLTPSEFKKVNRL
jgi:AraC-like DNA-binding protein